MRFRDIDKKENEAEIYAPIRFRFKHILLGAFSLIVHTNTMENGYLDPQKRRLSKTPSKVRLSKTDAFVLVWTGENAENADVMNSIFSLPRRTKTYRLLIASVDVRKQFENASVDADSLYPFSLDKKRRHTKTD